MITKICGYSTENSMKKLINTTGLSLFALTMLITGSIDSIRNLPATALFGEALIFFVIIAAIIFLIPTGLVSAQLASAWPKKGGIYNWCKMALGEKGACLAIWFQWINTMVWFPTILSFIAGTAAYFIDPALAHNKYYLIGVIVIVFWSLTIINMKGIQTSAKVASFCALVGTIIPIGLILLLGLIWIFSGRPLQLHLTMSHLIPSFGKANNWISLTAIMAAFLGLELATVHVNKVNHPQTTFPKSLLLSVIIVLITMVFGSLTIAFVLPNSQIGLVDGVMQVFANFLSSYHLIWLIPVITLMLLIGSAGSLINWIISPTKGLMQAAEDGYLPKLLSRKNKHDVPSNLLLVQAILVTLICCAFLLLPSVNASYWLLTDLSTQIYMFMYILMFIAALLLAKKVLQRDCAFRIPGGLIGMYAVIFLGFLGCITAITVGFIPPANLNIGSAAQYEALFVGGLIIMTLPVLLLYAYKKILSSSLPAAAVTI